MSFKRIIFLCFLISPTLYGTPDIPNDEDVLIQIKQEGKDEYLYPFGVQLLVWNVYKGEKDEWGPEFINMSRKYDLFLIQEGLLNSRNRIIFEFFYNTDILMATSWLDKGEATGVMNISNSRASAHIWKRSPDREPILNTPKMSLFSYFPLASGEKLLLANVHMLNFVGIKSFKNMLNQIDTVLSKHNGPLVIGGDFNTWTKEKMAKMKATFKKLNLTELRFKNDLRKKVFNLPLDHIWYRGVQPVKQNVFKTEASDHNPMEFIFDII